MGKKLAFASLFFSGGSVDSAATESLSPPYSPPPSVSAVSSGSTAASWQWPSCAQARTASFDGRSSVEAEASSSAWARRDCCRTTRVITNPAYCDDDTADSSFFSATGSSSASTAAPEPEPSVEEAVIRGVGLESLGAKPKCPMDPSLTLSGRISSVQNFNEISGISNISVRPISATVRPY
ncbi:unnamed protein product [Triticum turgidum subsp. durum]|uniref:Uncharacterized protein n=1 Tax=Triticum turgidum subsp. durum TaxID=4567 RepID=A0A9R1RF74_TRITD|nr:unnamed protein product [Triticum turgidum subsp. durum]